MVHEQNYWHTYIHTYMHDSKQKALKRCFKTLIKHTKEQQTNRARLKYCKQTGVLLTSE